MTEAKKTAEEAPGGMGEFEEMTKLIRELSRNPETSHLAESVAATLLMVIGSGPSFAAMQSMLAANQASSAMYYNAVANQQAGHMIGMVATMNCVQTLLDKPASIPWPDMSNPYDDLTP